MSQPNVILFICDQLRGDALGCDGNTVAQTPNIDYLASRGSRFSHAYSAVPSCLPARAMLWSGQDQWHAGLLGMGRGQGSIPDDFPHTLAGELRDGGYRTHLVGKGHFHPHRAAMGFESHELDESGRTMRSGFLDEYRTWFEEHAPKGVTPDDHGVFWNSWHARPWHTEEHLHPTAWTGSRAIEFLRTRQPDRPFFLNVSFARPHSPYVPPRPYWDRYIDETLPQACLGDWSTMHDDPFEAADPNAWRGRMSAEQIHQARAGYYGEVSFIDTQVGRILNYLYRFDRQAMRNTWFVFISDHGDMLGDHNLWRKTYAYEGSTRIPFIVMPPLSSAMEARSVVEEPVGLDNIMPTVLAAAGVQCPETVTGDNLIPLMTGDAENWRPYIHGEHCWCYSREQEMQYITDGRRKLVWLPRLGVEQFFDLENDPGECRNLVDNDAYADEVDHWRQCLVTELEKRDCGWVRQGQLHCDHNDPLVSPYKTTRWQG